MKNILDVLEINKNTNPDKVAVICEESSLTYSELYEYSDRLANRLRKMGINKGDVIGLMFPNIVEFVVSYFAILRVGGIILPINVIYNESEVKFVLEDSDVKFIIYWDKFKNLIENVLKNIKNNIQTISIGGKELKEELSYQYSSSAVQERYKSIFISENDISSILYTSGTTSSPKGAMHSYKNFAYATKVWSDLISMAPDDKFLAVLPLFHPFSQAAILNPCMWASATLVLQPRLDIEDTIQIINRKEITLFFGVSAILELMLKKHEEKEFEIPSLRLCISGINYCPERISNKFEKIFNIPVLECYGTTETLFVASSSKIGRERKINSIGFPVKEVEIQTIDENDNILSVNDMGEIQIKSDSIMVGYKNHPELTGKVLKKEWFYTGDIGIEDENGFFYLLDKKSDVIKKGGFSVFSTEIESLLTEYEKIKEAAVVGVPDNTKIEEIKACVILNDDATSTEKEIIEFCKSRLPIYKCPKYVEFYKSLPKSATGKILKKLVKTNYSKV